MKVEIEISEQTARVLRSWASLGRFCDCAHRVAMDAIPESGIATADQEDLLDSVETLKPALMELHYNLRQVLVAAGIQSLWPQ